MKTNELKLISDEMADDLDAIRREMKICDMTVESAAMVEKWRTVIGNTGATAGVGLVGLFASSNPLAALGGIALIELARTWNEKSASHSAQQKMGLARDYLKRQVVDKIVEHKASLIGKKNIPEIAKTLEMQNFIDMAMADFTNLPDTMRQTIEHAYLREVAQQVQLGIKKVVPVDGGVKSINNDIKEGFRLLNADDEIIESSLEKLFGSALDKIDGLSGTALKKLSSLEKKQLKLLMQADSSKTALDDLTANLADFAKAKKAQRNAKIRKEFMTSAQLIGGFGHLLGNNDLVKAGSIAATTVHAIDVIDNLNFKNTLETLASINAMGQLAIGVYKLFSKSKPDPFMEQLRLLSNQLGELRFEVLSGIKALEEGQRRIVERICIFSEEISRLVISQTDRLAILMTQRFDHLQSRLELYNRRQELKLNELVFRPLKTLISRYSRNPEVMVKKRYEADKIYKDLDRLYSWGFLESKQWNGLFGDAVFEIGLVTSNEMLYCDPLEIPGYFWGYLKQQLLDNELFIAFEAYELPNINLWLEAAKLYLLILKYLPNSFLKQESKLIVDHLQSFASHGIFIQQGLRVLFDQSTMLGLLCRYTKCLDICSSAYKKEIDSLKAKGVENLDTNVTYKISLPVNSYISLPEIDLPIIYMIATERNLGRFECETPVSLGEARVRSRTAHGHTRLPERRAIYAVLSQTKFVQRLLFIDRDGRTFAVGTRCFMRKLEVNKWINHKDNVLNATERLTDSDLLTKNNVEGNVIQTVDIQSFNLDSVSGAIKTIKEYLKLQQTENLARVKSELLVSNISKDIEQLDILRGCLFRVLTLAEPKEHLPENFDQLLLSKQTIEKSIRGATFDTINRNFFSNREGIVQLSKHIEGYTYGGLPNEISEQVRELVVQSKMAGDLLRKSGKFVSNNSFLSAKKDAGSFTKTKVMISLMMLVGLLGSIYYFLKKSDLSSFDTNYFSRGVNSDFFKRVCNCLCPPEPVIEAKPAKTGFFGWF